MSQPHFNPQTGRWAFRDQGPPRPGNAPNGRPFPPGHPEPPHGGSAGPVPPMPNATRTQPRRGRRWPWVLGIAAAFVAGLAIPTGGSSEPVAEASNSAPGAAGPAPRAESFAPGAGYVPGSLTAGAGPFTLEATSGSGKRVDVTYANGTGGIDQDTVSSGWSVSVPEGRSFSSGTFSVSSTFTGDTDTTDTVTCRVKDSEGNVLAEDTAKGQYATAMCMGY